MTRNPAASIRARLKNRSDETKQDFNLTLTHYGLVNKNKLDAIALEELVRSLRAALQRLKMV